MVLAVSPIQSTSILPGWSLRCLVCGFLTAPVNYPRGCPSCLSRGETQALIVSYDDPGTLPPRERTADGIWKAADLLPSIALEHRRTLGEGDTPLIQLPAINRLTGSDRLYLKMETQNPTAAHKDRFHAVSVAVGKALGYEGVVSWSTGNHGLSMTSYAVAHGMRAVVIANERMPLLLQRAIRFLGGVPLLVPESLAENVMTSLVEDEGWYPSSTSWPMPMANPFGCEGYKTIGFEIYRQLGDRMPDLVFFPSAAGDGPVGLWRAIADLKRIGAANTETRICPCQPATAAPLVAALDARLETVAYLPNAHSRALSIGDPISGNLALRAVRETNGFGVAVTDEDILATGRLLARNGLLVEPSSAASLAGAIKTLKEKPELRDQSIVCVITSSGLKWLDHYQDTELPAGIPITTLEDVKKALN